MELGISVVICTYNGARLLPKTLMHLARQQVHENIKWEVLVIDNASTDNTQMVICDVWADGKSAVPITVLYQPKPGLTHARHMALENASYEFILFCHDNNWLAPHYVNTAYNLMVSRPYIGVLGGCGELVFETKVPLWARGHGMFANGAQAKVSGQVPNNVVYGPGCVLRKSAYQKLLKANFSPLITERQGSCLSAGVDYELCYNIALAGYTIWYEDRLRFKHFIPSVRLARDYTIRLLKEGARSFECLVPYRIFLNKGARSKGEFYLYGLLMMASYLIKWIKALLSYVSRFHKEEERDFYYLKATSALAKLTVLLQHRALYANFLKIGRFAQLVRRAKGKRRKSTPQVMSQTYLEACRPW